MTLRSVSRTKAAHEGGNEDALLADDAHALYAVSDGVGRYRGAATASRLIIETVARELAGDAPPGNEARRAWLLAAAKKAAKALALEAKKARELASMSATLTLLRAIGDERWLLHVGDSRAYVFSEGRLEQLTRDHSLAFEQFEAGAITKEALRTHPNQKLLTRTLRASSTIVLPEVSVAPLRAGELYLLCTDGLTKALTDEEIAAELAPARELEVMADALLGAALRAGATDDVSFVVLVS